MNIKELIEIAINNVEESKAEITLLDKSVTRLARNINGVTRITFQTDQKISSERTELSGIVLWLDRDFLEKTVNSDKEKT